jgi:hypothetical protein
MSMRRKLVIVAVILLASLTACSCTRSGSEDAGASDSDSRPREGAWGGSNDSDVPSEAARSRGVPPYERREESEEGEPQIAIRGLSYEWRLEPQKGLHVRIDFVNTRDTYARVRDYLFLVATSTAYPSAPAGVYPWDARFEAGRPEKHTDGNRLLFRDELESRAFLPYRAAEGYFDHLRILVYNEDGTVAIDLGYDLEITGEPSGPIEAAPLSVTM